MIYRSFAVKTNQVFPRESPRLPGWDGSRVLALLVAATLSAHAQPYWKSWPIYVSPSGDFNDPANWAGGDVPMTNDTVNILSVGTGWLGGNVDIHYVPIAGVASLAEIDMSASINNTLNFFYQWPGADLTINHWLDLTEGVTFRHTNGTLTVDDLRVHDGAVYRMDLNSTPVLHFGTAFISENSRLELSSGLIQSVGNTLELQATGGNPAIVQTGGTLEVSQLFMNYEEAGSYTMTGGTLTLPGNVGVGKLRVGTSDYETASPVSTGTSTFSLGGTGLINGHLVEVMVGAYGRPGEMTQSGSSHADLDRLLVGLQSDGSYEISSGTLEIDTMLAVGGDGLGAAGTGTFNQTGGSVVVGGTGGVPGQLVVGGSGGSVPVSRYTFQGGTLQTDTLRVENGSLFEQFNNRSLAPDAVTVRGVYFFDSGSIATDAFDVNGGGSVVHRGDLTIADNGDPFDYEMLLLDGTHQFQQGSLTNHGDLAILSGGLFDQSGAIHHTLDGKLVVDATGSYRMNGIGFQAGSVETGGDSTFLLENGTVVTPTAMLHGGEFHFDGGNLDCPLVEVDQAMLLFNVDSTLDIDRLEFLPLAVNRLGLPAGRTVEVRGDVEIGALGGLDVNLGAALTAVDLEIGPGNGVDAQGWGDVDLSGELRVTGTGNKFEQREGQTTGASLRVDADAGYWHRGGTTLFPSTWLGPDAYLFGGGGTCSLGALELRENAAVEIGSGAVSAGFVHDQNASGGTPSLTLVGGGFTATGLDLGASEVITEGGSLQVTGGGVLRGMATFSHEAVAGFGSLGISGGAGWTSVPGSTLDVTGNLTVSTDGETLDLRGDLVDVGGVFSVRQVPGDAGVADLSGNADLLVGSDFEVGEFGAPGGTFWRQAGSSRMDVESTTRIGVSGLTGGPSDRVYLVDNSALYSGDLLVGEQGDGALEQYHTSSVILDHALRIGAIAGEGEYVLNGGSLSGTTMTIGEVNAGSRFLQSGGTAAFSGAVTVSGIFENDGGSFSAGTFTVAGDASVSGSISAPVDNQGILKIGAEGSAEHLAITGTFTNAPARRLGFDITGPPGASGNRDTLDVSGHAALAGRIDLKLPPALAVGVQLGDRWRVLTAGSRSGGFFAVVTDAPGLPANRRLYVEYGPTYVDVVVRPPTLSFETWIKDWGLDPADWDPEADPNFNGLPNILEFALGMNPAVSGPSPIQYLFDRDGWFAMTFPKPDYIPAGVGYDARFSVALDGGWSEADIVENSDATFTARIRREGLPPPNGFIQLLIEY